jgi:CelD/BcsL family acetyltransferase involved in cellulose biosynthesis
MNDFEFVPALITDPAEIASIEDDWRCLAEPAGNAFVTPEWFKSWWEHRPAATSPVIATARRSDGSLAGVTPLVLDFARRPRMIRFAGASFGDRFMPVAREAEQAAVAATTMRALGNAGLDRYTLVLNHIDPHGSWWKAIQRESAGQRVAIVQQRFEQPYIALEGLDWEGYLESRSSSFRKKLRQRERKLENAHEIVVRSATTETLETDLSRFFALHESRWQGGSSLDSPNAREFLCAFARAADRNGWLRLRLLEVDGTAVAAFFGWRLGGTFTFYQSGFDPSWSDLSVGIVLLTRTIRAAIEEGASEFDMLLGTEDYKRRFQNASRDVQTVVLPKAMAPARLLVAAEARARTWGHRVARRPVGAATSRTLRRLLPTSRNF